MISSKNKNNKNSGSWEPEFFYLYNDFNVPLLYWETMFLILS